MWYLPISMSKGKVEVEGLQYIADKWTDLLFITITDKFGNHCVEFVYIRI